MIGKECQLAVDAGAIYHIKNLIQTHEKSCVGSVDSGTSRGAHFTVIASSTYPTELVRSKFLK